MSEMIDFPGTNTGPKDSLQFNKPSNPLKAILIKILASNIEKIQNDFQELMNTLDDIDKLSILPNKNGSVNLPDVSIQLNNIRSTLGSISVKMPELGIKIGELCGELKK